MAKQSETTAKALLPCPVCGAMAGPEAPRREYISYLKTALREIADAADIIGNSNDSAHWDRLYRAIAQAKRLGDE